MFGVNFMLPPQLEAEDITGWNDTRWACCASRQAEQGFQLEFARRSRRALGDGLTVIDAADHKLLRGPAFYDLFLDRSRWPELIAAATNAPRSRSTRSGSGDAGCHRRPPENPGRPGSPAGLSEEAARRALAEHGPNVLAEAEGPHWVLRFARNFTHLFALLLWAGAALALVGGMPELSVAIVAVIVVNAIFSFAQEYRAERAVEALRQMLPQRVSVRRDGRRPSSAAEELVPGDVMLLAAGDRVSADGGLLSSVELRVDMSALTGESRPVRGAAPGPRWRGHRGARSRLRRHARRSPERARRSSPRPAWRPSSGGSRR